MKEKMKSDIIPNRNSLYFITKYSTISFIINHNIFCFFRYSNSLFFIWHFLILKFARKNQFKFIKFYFSRKLALRFFQKSCIISHNRSCMYIQVLSKICRREVECKYICHCYSQYCIFHKKCTFSETYSIFF